MSEEIFGGRNKDGGQLIGQGTYGCVYYPGIKCPNKKGNYKKYVTKLEVVDNSLKSELEISKIIRQIKNYKNFFVPILKKCPIKISSLDKDDIQADKCDVLEKNTGRDFVLIYMRYIKGKDLFTFINDIISTNNSIIDSDNLSKKLLFYYKYLLQGLELFLTKELVHMDLKNDNVMIENTKTKYGRPLIIDYGLSINMKDVKDILNNKSENDFNILHKLKNIFIAYAPEVNYWPFEIQIITYILYKNTLGVEKFLNKENISLVINDIMRENKIYKSFNSKYIDLFKNQAQGFMNRFIGYTNIDVIKELIVYYKTWDNFALSIMFLRILDNIEYKLNNNLDNVKKFKSIERTLIKNINMDPQLRLSISDTSAEIR